MSDIPEDVMDAARSVVDDINLNDASAAPSIARAILAERERCAMIVDRLLLYADTTSNADKAILIAIRGV